LPPIAQLATNSPACHQYSLSPISQRLPSYISHTWQPSETALVALQAGVDNNLGPFYLMYAKHLDRSDYQDYLGYLGFFGYLSYFGYLGYLIFRVI
jgi:hypothetical protein